MSKPRLSAAPRLLAARRILVVEDEYFIADDLTRLLQAEGADIVGPFSEVEEGARVAASDARIDGAILDINLHGEPVYPVADALLERGVPFIFATGYSAASIPAVYSGAPRMEKPYDLRMVAHRLAGLIDRQGSPRLELLTKSA